jgi:hypothetical protein
VDDQTDQPLEYEPQRPPMRLVTVAAFANAESANLARLHLESEQIPCCLDNENTAITLWYIQPAVGGIKLQVPEEFADEARELLRDTIPQDVVDNAQALDEPAEPESSAEVIVCPTCHSTDTERLSWGYRVMQAIVIVLLSVSLTVVHPWLLLVGVGYAAYFLLTKPSYRCLRCRKRWN